MRKRITAITVGICLATVAFLSLTAFSCFGFGVEDKVFTTEGVSITLNSGFKKESIKADDLESDDPVTQGTIFKYRDSKSGMLVVGAKVAKSEMAKFNAFDLPGFAKVVRELYSENKKIEYVEEPTTTPRLHSRMTTDTTRTSFSTKHAMRTPTSSTKFRSASKNPITTEA